MKAPLRPLLLALPFVMVALGARMLVPRWGDAIARTIQDVAGAPPPRAPEPSGATSEPADDDGADDDAGAAASMDAGLAKRAAAVIARALDGGGRDDGGPLAVYVKADAVDKTLARFGKHLHGRTARGPDGRPIGVRLSGISAAGLGLLDGDLVVAIDGQPTMDDDVATDVVLSAIAHGKNVLHAKLLRGDRPIDLTLEVPLDAAQAEAETPKKDAPSGAGAAAKGRDGDGGDARP